MTHSKSLIAAKIQKLKQGVQNQEKKVLTPAQEKKAVRALIDRGYTVCVAEPEAKLFSVKYQVFQGNSFRVLKIVVVNDEGKVIALQG